MISVSRACGDRGPDQVSFRQVWSRQVWSTQVWLTSLLPICLLFTNIRMVLQC